MISKTSALPRFISIAVFFALAFASPSCSKDIPSTEVLPAVTPANADANAGSWKMIVLTGPTQVSVTAPGATGDPAYQS
jgi:hypothetical protein